MKQFARMFGEDRGAEIHALIEKAMGPCPCLIGEPCWKLFDVVEKKPEQQLVVLAPTG